MDDEIKFTQVEMTREDANNLDDVVHELEIADSFETPAGAVRKLKEQIKEQAATIVEMAGALERSTAALDKMHKASVAGAYEGYGKPELWGDALFKSHHDAFEALKHSRSIISRLKGDNNEG